MAKKWTRRSVLRSTAGVAAAGLALPYAGRARAQGGTIAIGMEAGSPYDTFYRAHVAEFTDATGVGVEFVSIPHDSIRQTFVQDAMAGGGGFDVYIADQVWLPEFYKNGFIEDLSGVVDDADLADFSETGIQTTSYDGALVALPIMVHNCAMYWRTDYLQAAGHDLPPSTWDEYRSIAAATTGDDVWGTMILSKQGIEAATRLNSFYQQAGGEIVDASGAPTINTDAGRAALEFMHSMVFDAKAAPEGVLELPDMQGAWLEGRLALVPVWPYLYSLSLDPIGAENFAIGTAPGMNGPQGGTVYSWGFAAASGAANPDAAKEWVKWATSSQMLYRFGKEWLNPVPRASSIEMVRSDPDIADSDKAAIAAMAASASAGVSMPMVPHYSQLLDVLGVMQSGVMSGALTIDEALEQGQAQAEEAVG
jgi:ABC-type glycerol-3-phosphate transport system substrate-binding protein